MWSLVLSLAVVAAPSSDRPKVFALVIGNNRAAEAASPDLKFADDDAIAMHELLTEAGVKSLLLVRADDETRALQPSAVTATSPTPSAVRAAWDQIRAEITAAKRAGTTEFLFFFSGHGDVSQGEGYLALDGGKLTRSALQAMLGESPALRNHVVIDACKSYFAVLSRGAGGQREPYAQPFVERRAGGERSGFLLSTSSDGDSHEWARFQAGVFSFEVRSALRGSADVDRDGVLTYRELGGFLQRANAGIVNARFRPDFFVVPPGGDGGGGLDQPLLRWPESTSSLTVDGAATHFYVEASSGRRVLELHRAAGVGLTLRLPAERPLFVRTADEREERLLESSGPVAYASLTSKPASVSTKGALHVAFSQLFSRAFDAGAVDAFVLESQFRAVLPPEPNARAIARTTSLVVAGVALATAVTALGIGVERTSITPATSGQERLERNAALPAVNATMGVAASVTAAALGTWLVLTLTDSSDSTTSVGVGPNGASVRIEW